MGRPDFCLHHTVLFSIPLRDFLFSLLVLFLFQLLFSQLFFQLLFFELIFFSWFSSYDYSFVFSFFKKLEKCIWNNTLVCVSISLQKDW